MILFFRMDINPIGTLNFHAEQIKLLGKATSNGTERIDSNAINKQTANSADNDDLPF
jgi:hypothetical protein